MRLWECPAQELALSGNPCRPLTVIVLSASDFWEADDTVLPNKRHRAVGKDNDQTNRIERFNCTLRQRISRLVRKTLSFSKKLDNHIGAIWYFIHYYNTSLQL